jgi:oligopeptide transport system substrate-binding protein
VTSAPRILHLCRSTALAAAALLLLAGCNNNPQQKPWREKRPNGSPWRVFYWVMNGDVRSLDPQVSYDEVSNYILEPVHDCLLEYEVMETRPYKLGPCLLAEVPKAVYNADGSVTYHCSLKSGILFHDDPCFPGGKGREVVAQDVQYAFQRLCDPHLESPFFSNLADYVAGMQEAYDTAKKAGGKLDFDTVKVSGIEVLDPHHFDLKLKKAYPQIVYWMGLHCTTPVAREGVEYYDGKPHPDGSHGETVVRPLFAFHPVGDGAFELKDWVPGQRFRLVRNEHYKTMVFPSGGWPPELEATCRPLAGHALPLADEVQLTSFRELMPEWLLMRQGYLDRFGAMKDAANSLVTASKELAPKWAARGMKLTTSTYVSTFYMSFNMQDPVVGTNRKLRQAISCSYNPQGFIDLLYGGVAPVAQELLSPGIPGYDPNFRNPYGANVEKARRLIAEAGYPGGIDPKTGQPLEIALDGVAMGAEERQLMEYTQRQIEQCGIKIRVVEDTFARLLEKEDEGNFQMLTGTGWGADYPDPENYFFLFYSKNFPPEGKNVSRYKNPEFDRLFEQMATMENSPERMKISARMNEILIEDVPILLEFNKAGYIVSQPWAPRIQYNMLMDGGDLKYQPIDAGMRIQMQREWNRRPKWPIAAALAVAAALLGAAIAINRKRNV